MSNCRSHFKKKKDMATGEISAVSNITAAASPSYTAGTTCITGVGNSNVYGSNMLSGIILSSSVVCNIITLSSNGKEIVRLNVDGSVTWNNEINVDKAAEAFGKSISIGGEMATGITKRVKLKMRDSVFEDLINIAKKKGSLTAEDLTYLLEASKIVEKLKGGKE